MRRVLIIGLMLVALLPGWVGRGLAEGETEGGIVGTGINGDPPAMEHRLGVFGTVTGLGSIHVNGVRVTFEADAKVESPLGDFPARDLQPGSTVILEVIRRGRGYHAVRLREYLPLAGPVRIGVDGVRSVMGVSLGGQGAAFAEGEWIGVNGLWRTDGLSVSRLRAIPVRKAAVVMGDFRTAGATVLAGTVSLNGILPQHAVHGTALLIQGKPLVTGIRAESIKKGLFGPKITTILAEGHLSRPLATGEYSLLGSGLVAYDTTGMEVSTGRALYCVQSDGIVRYDRNLMLPDRAELRIDRLEGRLSERNPCLSGWHP